MQKSNTMKKMVILCLKTGVGEKAMKNACYNCEDSHFNATVTYVTGDKKGKDVEWAVLYTMAF